MKNSLTLFKNSAHFVILNKNAFEVRLKLRQTKIIIVSKLRGKFLVEDLNTRLKWKT